MNITERALTSKSEVLTAITAITFLLLASFSFPSILSLQLQQQAEATAYGLIDSRVPPAYIIIDGKASKLQLDNHPLFGEEGGIADYSRPPQGTISFGERFQLLVPQVKGIIKDAQSAGLIVCVDKGCGNDDFHISLKRVDVRDTGLLFSQTYVIDAPRGVGDGFTANEIGFKIFLWWSVGFTDGTGQTYLAIVHLQGDPCEEHGWDTQGTKCVDFDF